MELLENVGKFTVPIIELLLSPFACNEISFRPRRWY
jgi:hypothetical protein